MFFLFLDRTTDIIVYEVTGQRFVKEIYRRCCWEGNALACEAVLSFFNQLVGHDVMSILKERYNDHYVTLVNVIDHKVQSFLYSTKDVRIVIPVVTFQEITKVPLQDLVSQSGLQKDVRLFHDRLKIKATFFRSFYENAFKYVSGILEIINSAIGKDDLSNIRIVILDGHLECAPILAEFIKQTLEPSIKVIIPSSSNAALKGAMLCGSDMFQ